MRLIVNKWALSLYSLQASIALRIEIAYGLKENITSDYILLNSELAHCSH